MTLLAGSACLRCVPPERHRVEPACGLVDERGVTADDPERAEREGLEVRTRPEQRPSVTFDGVFPPERGQRIEPRGNRCELPAADQGVLRTLELVEQALDVFELAALERQPDQRFGPSKVIDAAGFRSFLEPLRLFVVAPTPYRKRQSARRYYRHPAYLLTTDLRSGARALLQIYFDRWQIEVNHRDEKDSLGVGQAQLWNPVAVPKQPVLAVAAYSALLLASLLTFGAERGAAYAPLPKWRRCAHRPSCLDLITLLRKEMVEHPELLQEFDVTLTDRALTSSAAA